MKVVKLCSNVDMTVTNVVCDKPLGHSGPHEATITWGDEHEEEYDLGGEG